jgi:MerR family transcriptional regulator, light-induced transcriptional regulator
MSQSIIPNLSLAETFAPFLDALIAGDRYTCTRITDLEMEKATPVLSLYADLYQPALYRIGELWSANRVSVATEHMATSITEGLLNRIYPHLISPTRNGRKAVLATLEDELHQVGAKMAADVFEMHGWDSVFPGAGRPSGELLQLVQNERPDLVGLSFSIFFHLDTLERTLGSLRAEYPDLPIIVGGQGLRLGGEEVVAAFPGVSCVHSLDELTMLIAGYG